MRVLYILDRGIFGGIQRHTQCLANCLKDVCDVAVCIVGDRGPLYDQMLADGIRVYALDCRNGHDWRLFGRFERVLKEFQPDIVHGQVLPAFCRLWLRLRHSGIPVVISLHSPTPSRRTFFDRFLGFIFGCKVAYYLPVSDATWTGFKRWHPEAAGEVFYNPIMILGRKTPAKGWKNGRNPVVGMVARSAAVKDWASFHRIAEIVRHEMPDVGIWNLGEERGCPNGREMIGRMDIMLMTSLSEEMPTVVLEAFAEGTAVCGFIPAGGMGEILAMSDGSLRNVFVGDRDCEKVAQFVMKILSNEGLRTSILTDGWQIVTRHFDAMKNCRGRLMDIYKGALDSALIQ